MALRKIICLLIKHKLVGNCMCCDDVVVAWSQRLCCHLLNRVLMCFVCEMQGVVVGTAVSTSISRVSHPFLIMLPFKCSYKDIVTREDVLIYMTSNKCPMCTHIETQNIDFMWRWLGSHFVLVVGCILQWHKAGYLCLFSLMIAASVWTNT